MSTNEIIQTIVSRGSEDVPTNARFPWLNGALKKPNQVILGYEREEIMNAIVATTRSATPVVPTRPVSLEAYPAGTSLLRLAMECFVPLVDSISSDQWQQLADCAQVVHSFTRNPPIRPEFYAEELATDHVRFPELFREFIEELLYRWSSRVVDPVIVFPILDINPYDAGEVNAIIKMMHHPRLVFLLDYDHPRPTTTEWK